MDDQLDMNLAELMASVPLLKDFFAYLELPGADEHMTLSEYLTGLDDLSLEEAGLSRAELGEMVAAYLRSFPKPGEHKNWVDCLTILGGTDRDGRPESVEINIKAGEVVCLVGPTGSGKSRLLEDIEWLAQGDTPTGRTVLIDGSRPAVESMLIGGQRMVAQLSQNMNFVMDASVEDFIRMHAESRMLPDVDDLVATVLSRANDLSGEGFQGVTPITALSGGQSRALMIADVACLSSSPIVLIDEIENAGIERETALRLLMENKKIVMIATHDPILALMGQRRLIMKNGGIAAVVERTEREAELLMRMQAVDQKLNRLRGQLREGQSLDAVSHDF